MALQPGAHHRFGAAPPARPPRCRRGAGARAKPPARAAVDAPPVQILVGVAKIQPRAAGCWSGEGFRGNGIRPRVIRPLSAAQTRLERGAAGRQRPAAQRATEGLGQDSARGTARGAAGQPTRRQVTTQSSHGELSFHHNPHPRPRGLRRRARVARRRGARTTHAAPGVLPLRAMRYHAKTWRRPRAATARGADPRPAQPVLITASGPQASNALAHRARHAQGSRQSGCVSSREALALRARARAGPRARRARSAASELLTAGNPTV